LEDRDHSAEKKSRSNTFDISSLLYHHHRRHSMGNTVALRDQALAFLAIHLQRIVAHSAATTSISVKQSKSLLAVRVATAIEQVASPSARTHLELVTTPLSSRSAET
jgi:hypothetical protein